MTRGRMAKCAHCGVLSFDEALACEMGDCQIVDWDYPRREPRPTKKPKLAAWAQRIVDGHDDPAIIHRRSEQQMARIIHRIGEA